MRYLEGLPDSEQREVAAGVAFSAAARVLAIAAHDFATSSVLIKRDLTAVAIFGALSIAGVAALTSTPAIASGTSFAATAANIWDVVRLDLADGEHGPLWRNGEMPNALVQAWADAKTALGKDPKADWSFWIALYERVLAGCDFLPNEMAPTLNKLRKEDWKKDPAHINPMFDEVLALYRAQDAAFAAGGLDLSANVTLNVKVIRSQLFTLEEYLDAEYLYLSGHNAPNPEQDDILELLKDLKALVEAMMERFEEAGDESQAFVVVREDLPAFVEKAGELEVVETEPQVSATIVTTSTSIKMLCGAGADPKLATQIAMSDAASKKLGPSLQRFFSWGKKLGD